MKRIALLLLVLCLLLCACGRKSAESTETTGTAQVTTDATQATTEQTNQETAPSTTEAVQTEIRHPLTGELLDTPWTGRATAVVINNHEEALPQHGVTQADILYEIETEGGITRRLGIFTDMKEIDRIGPVRSARTYFINVATSYDAPLAHCGGSEYAMKAHYDSEHTLNSWDHIDAMYYTPLYFFRDADRLNNGYALEHTLFTTGENMRKAMKFKDYNTVNKDGTDYGFVFAEAPEMDGKKAKEVTIGFRGGKKTTATYNNKTGLYEISQYGSVGVDGNNDAVLASRNVLVIYAKQTKIDILSFYDLIGSGEGHFACDGKIIPIKWTREAVEDPFTYTTTDGKPLTLGVGNSYIAVTAGKISYK